MAEEEKKQQYKRRQSVFVIQDKVVRVSENRILSVIFIFIA